MLLTTTTVYCLQVGHTRHLVLVRPLLLLFAGGMHMFCSKHLIYMNLEKHHMMLRAYGEILRYIQINI